MLQWVIEGDITGELKEFHVRQASPQSTEVFKTTANYYIFTGLKPDSPYTFEVAAENVQGGLGDYAQKPTTTGKPIHLDVNLHLPP